jgi:hypothetical protein
MRLIAELASLAYLLRGLFVWSVPALALWHLLARTKAPARWNKAIGIIALLGAASGLTFLVSWAARTAFTLTGPDAAEAQGLIDRLTGPYAVAYWGRIVVLGILPLLLVRKAQRSWWWLWGFAWLLWDPFAQFGWLVVLVTSFHRDHEGSLAGELFWSSWLVLMPTLLLVSAGVMRHVASRSRTESRANAE